MLARRLLHPPMPRRNTGPVPCRDGDEPMIELVTTAGLFRLDGGEWEVTNNIWLVGDDREVIVIDAAHDAAPIVEAVNGRRVAAIALTHGHNDHINAAVALQDAVDAPILLHPDDRMLWHDVYGDRDPDAELEEGGVLRADGDALGVLHTPGHSPGGCCFVLESGGHVFSGDTLFCGGPGRHRPQLQRLPDDRRVDPRPPAHAPARDPRAHRPRRHHDHRSGGSRSRGVAPPRPLTNWLDDVFDR